MKHEEATVQPAPLGRVERGVGRLVPERCGILHGGDTLDPDDEDGCLLPNGHDGPHEFAAPDGSLWRWETDIECTCAHCMRCDGDYCTIYWPVADQKTPNVGAKLPHAEQPAPERAEAGRVGST